MTHIFKASQSRAQVDKARQIKNSIGIRFAAGYLRNRGWSLDGALFVLMHTFQRFEELA